MLFLKLFKTKNANTCLIRICKKNLFLGKHPLIKTQTLNKLIRNGENIKIIDSSIKINYTSSKEQSKLEEKIPGALYINSFNLSEDVDLDFVIPEDKEQYGSLMQLSHPFPLPENNVFIEKMKYFKLKKSDNVVIYDQSEEGIFSSARLWFILRLYGLKNVYVLNGGFKKWKSEKLPTEKFKENKISNENVQNDALYKYKKEEGKLTKTEEMLYEGINIIKAMSKNLILDARAPEICEGKIKDPYPLIRAGHLKGSLNFYYKLLLDDKGCLLPPEKIKEVIKKNSELFENSSKIIVFSGIGVSACVVILALDCIGLYDKIVFYPGGWFEMGNVPESNNLVQKIKQNEENTPLAKFEKVVRNFDPVEQERIRKLELHELKLREIQEKNKEYLLKKEKKKRKDEGDYTSPEEMF